MQTQENRQWEGYRRHETRGVGSGIRKVTRTGRNLVSILQDCITFGNRSSTERCKPLVKGMNWEFSMAEWRRQHGSMAEWLERQT